MSLQHICRSILQLSVGVQYLWKEGDLFLRVGGLFCQYYKAENSMCLSIRMRYGASWIFNGVTLRRDAKNSSVSLLIDIFQKSGADPDPISLSAMGGHSQGVRGQSL